ncbi:precorrin-3B C(17)-methyltransferase [Porphyromonas levii]|uniref:precorrin-3B C(17)-methyltransferase n=1 Tax=Porphyromonas levii TaxID=28114 RepID=UPI0003644A7C|nr:precorrin-3B C(17)-methyltransferase [Porphyromonas levii]MBR8763502.1 Siroheme synthase [Porphyromonas levii]MBR8765599.1 Siroheme synthase [Porphyromonas levii]MBR8769543.1 Siroheme synthase [Porphyromonas levii]MBR8784759.1 Siroheme synthase [Porphyromonas levii]MBR8802910.1 Siroheme synthase [Porphyromonas levii]
MGNKGKIYIAGIGPGRADEITPAVQRVLGESDAVVGYDFYFQFVSKFLKEGAECIDSGMRQERARAELAFEQAEQGKVTCVISSGDAGIYGMAPLMYEMREERSSDIELEVLPGISAFQEAASILGAPIGHDFCIISLSDLMTPWATIERRVVAAADADFVTAIYNPKSHKRFWQLERVRELFLKSRSADTPVGIVRQAGREDQSVIVTTLGEMDIEVVDMFTVVLIGNSQTYLSGDTMITPRGYYREKHEGKEKIGQQIMMQSFRTISSLLKQPDVPLDHKWALLHAIHTTADFDMEQIFYSDADAVAKLHERFKKGEIKTIITDVTMVVSGIRKGALERLGIEAKCYLHDPRIADMAEQLGITRTQAGVRLAVEEHPDALFAFGNAPTALMELAHLIRRGKATPSGIVAAPVGFVNVCESKQMIKPFKKIPKLIIEGRKGGSNLAATLVNAILTYDDAAALKPGRDV